jgi:trimeric autotransporter adhesin
VSFGFPPVGGGGGGGPWTQTAEVIATNDTGAALEGATGSATGTQGFAWGYDPVASVVSVAQGVASVGFAGGSALGNGSFAAVAQAAADGARAVSLVGASANADESFAASGGGTFTPGVFSTALSGGITTASGAFAAVHNATAENTYDVALGFGATAFGDGVNGALAFAGSSATNDLSIAGASATIARANPVGFGSVTVSVPDAYKIGQDGEALLSLNADGFGTCELDAGSSQAFVFGNAFTQTTSGAGGGASPFPLAPDAYWLVTVAGTQYVIPLILPV